MRLYDVAFVFVDELSGRIGSPAVAVHYNRDVFGERSCELPGFFQLRMTEYVQVLRILVLERPESLIVALAITHSGKYNAHRLLVVQMRIVLDIV